MAEIKETFLIASPIEKVWQALVDPEIIAKWSNAPARMSAEVGFEFELWNGDISGVNTAVEKPNKLVQEWQYGDWPKPSIVTFDVTSTDDHTEIKLTQTGHPSSEEKDLKEGWDIYYLGAIKKYLEAN
ncbi:MAG: SRPBCC domain-containing protein [Patescibacteria group bacterium]